MSDDGPGAPAPVPVSFETPGGVTVSDEPHRTPHTDMAAGLPAQRSSDSRTTMELAEDPGVRVFYVDAGQNDGFAVPCRTQMDSDITGKPELTDHFRFNIPDGEVWFITDVDHALSCGDQRQNPVGLVMHIFLNQTSLGRNFQLWTEFGHFAQWQFVDQTIDGRGVSPPYLHLVTDRGEANYWRTFHEERLIRMPGPARVQVGIYNDNVVGGPAANAYLRFCVSKDPPTR